MKKTNKSSIFTPFNCAKTTTSGFVGAVAFKVSYDTIKSNKQMRDNSYLEVVKTYDDVTNKKDIVVDNLDD